MVDPGTGAIATVDGTGPAAGLADGRLIAFEPCDGLPCGVDAVDLGSGAATRLGKADGPVLAAPDARGLIVLADKGGLGVAIGSTADSGAEAPSGLVAVAPGGLVENPSAVRFLDPATLKVTLGEVLP